MAEEYHDVGQNSAHTTDGWWEETPENIAMHQPARDAVMRLRLFPDLLERIRQAVGYGPHADMLQHLVFWFHPRHPKTQERWDIWKTREEWQEKLNLSRERVDRGREKLRKAGLVSWTRGRYSRIHYQVNWVALADALGCKYETINPEFMVRETHPQGVENTPPKVRETHPSIQKSTSEEIPSEETPLQGGGLPLSAPTPPTPIDRNKHGKEKPKPPPEKPDDALLSEVAAILNPETKRWSYARLVTDGHTPKSLAAGIRHEEDEHIVRGEVVEKATEEQIRKVIEYMRFEDELKAM